MPRIAILEGASKLGLRLIHRALAREFTVHALAPNPKKIESSNYELTVFQGDPRVGSGLTDLLKRCHAVVYAPDAPSGETTGVMQQLLRNLKPAAASGDEVSVSASVRALPTVVFVTRAGVSESAGQDAKQFGLLAWFSRGSRKAALGDLGSAESMLRASGLAHVIVRPTILTDDLSADAKVAEPTDPPPGPISREAVARFVIGMLEADDWPAKWMGRAVTVGS